MDNYEKARKLAAGYVASRMYTCRELEDKLCRKKIDKETAERVVGDFAAAGILDDAAYAEAYVYDAVNLGYKGAYRIKQELYVKGVARSIADRACADIGEEAYRALCEYVEGHRLCEGITTRKELEKLKARLVRRGYSSTEIRECLSEYEFELED